MAEPERRRRRPTVSCSLCRRRKVRCNRETPCNNCVRSGNQVCAYESFPSRSLHRPSSRAQTTEFSPALQHQELPQHTRGNNGSSKRSTVSTTSAHPPKSIASSTSASTIASRQSTQNAGSTNRELGYLGKRLTTRVEESPQSPFRTPDCKIETTSGLSEPFHIHHENRYAGQLQTIPRSIMHKTRLFGQSHWANGITLFRDILEIVLPHARDGTSKVSSNVQRCKSLAKLIKSRRIPSWPSPPSVDLPPKDVADELVDCYMRTIESVHRILHIPSFKREYEALWLSNTQYDTAIRVQIKLVLAIGATTYDEQFSLRSSAIRWVYEAQTWLSEPELKSRLNLQTLQTQMLLFIARETAGVDASLTWISAGALLRMAVFMGLHRDPSCLPKRTAFVAEMRRRLWNTILEMTLQSSMTSGAPPLLSIDDFDTEPPRNFDDDQLVGEDLVPTEEDRYTSVSIAIALRKTFPLRLAIAKFLNDVGSRGTYEETLQLDAQLRASYKILRHTLQEFSGSTGASPSRFALRVVDFIMHRYLSSLHIPFFGSALHESTYAFSRKVVVENSLKMWCAVYPPSSITSAPSHENMTTSEQDDLMRLTICGSTFFRDDAKQASLLIALELRRHLQEEESLGPVLLRPDLFRVVCDAKTWCLQCIDAGETNIKGYLFVCIVAMQIEGLMKGVGKNEMSSLLLNAAEEALEKSLLTPEEKVGQGQNEEMADEPNSEFAHMASELVDDWDLMATDDLFNLGNLDITSWMLTNNADQGLSLS